jgi:hypothetical protein
MNINIEHQNGYLRSTSLDLFIEEELEDGIDIHGYHGYGQM